MKTMIAGFLTIFAFLSVISAFGQSPVKWTEFESKEGGFKILFPSEPKTSDIETELPTGKNRTYWVEVLTNRYFFAVSYKDNPNPSGSSTSRQENIDFMEQQFVENVNGKLILKREITVGEVKGREIIVENLGERSIVRLLLVGNRVFTNIVTMRINDFEKAEMAAMASKFFESFVLTTISKK